MNLINNEQISNRHINKSSSKRNSSLQKIIINHELNINLYNTKNCINTFCILKLSKKILSILILSLIMGLIIFSILYYKKINKKSSISINYNINNVEEKEGFYIPKDNLSIIKKCSVENCKKCYGNTYDNVCTSCKKSYDSVKDENNKIISCNYNPQKEEDTNIKTTILEE